MNRLIPLTSALVLAFGAPSLALAQKDNGNGKGGGKESHGQQGRGDKGGHQKEARGGGEGRGQSGKERGGGPDRILVPSGVRDVPGQGLGKGDRKQLRRDIDGDVVIFRRHKDRGLVDGCPPGLAKKNNGCLPPGQARKIDNDRDGYARYNYLWRMRADNGDYLYRDGYLYRVNRQGGVIGYLPVLGGVLSLGNAWPGQYDFQPAPRYYSQYYRLNDRYQYRYADGVLYGVDPQTQGIGQIAALLTGQQFNVGQRMPAGYDVYNLPYDYRDRYADSPQSHYRYNDGYIYQVDPTTRLVQAVIQLLT